MSLRAEFLRIGLRWFVKRRMGSVDDLRRSVAAITPYIPAPSRRTRTDAISIAGVPAHSIVTAAFENDRHVLYLHGGAYVSGSPSLYRDLTWRIAKRARARVLCVGYRLAPEHPFPAAVDDATAVYRALIGEGVDPARIALAGDSAGGGLAFAAVLKIRDDGLPMPAAIVALSPWTDLALTGTSLTRNAGTESILRISTARRHAEYYLAGADPRTPYASPLYGDLAGLPPALIQVGSDEAQLDDSVRMADRLREAGCEVELQIWPRMPHGWQLFARLLPEARQAIERIGVFLRARM